ncbi:PR domain zinc finger protein 5-like [Tigriopus californicus]|uniref:PR domain zinc finger protein 5-like n=1 Tax=Tigriopus californicus TaxID=6832 RepID=UPI0027DA5FD3|nr:PR domain zinc finger protein 5-like [Tigriopus californicus]
MTTILKKQTASHLDYGPDSNTLAKSGLVKMEYFSWVWITRDTLDFVTNVGWPLPSLSFLLNGETGEFICRVLNQTYRTGRFHNEQDMLHECINFFHMNFPCLGIDYQESDDFPYQLKFSPTCLKIVHLTEVPDILEGLMCSNCQEWSNKTSDEFPSDPKVTDSQPFDDELLQTSILSAAKNLFTTSKGEDNDSDGCDITLSITKDDGDSHVLLETQNPTENVSTNGNEEIEVFHELRKTSRKRRLPRSFKDYALSTTMTQGTLQVFDADSQDRQRPKIGQRDRVLESFVVEWKGQDQVLHLRHDKEQDWTCPFCSKTLTPKQGVRGHLRGHFMIYVQCGICQVPHYCPLKLWDHYQQQHQLEEEWKVKCSGCYEVHDIKPSRSTFRSHLLTCKRKSNQTKSSKPKKPWTRSPKVCDICGLTLQTDYHLRSHKSRVHENKVIIWQCHICDLEMNDNKKYSHLRKIHLHSRFSCTICNLRLRTGRSFLDHVLENHRGELESFKCPECKDDIPIESEEGPNFADHHEDCLRQHIKRLKDGVKQRTSSKPLKFPCPICAKRFPTQWLLNTHIRGHKDSGHFCSQCRYRTHSALHLRAHVARVHGESENGIKCEFCEDRFQTQDSIQEHLSRMHGIESEYQCQLCPLKTADKIQMRKHMKQCHPNYGPELKCDECHLVFQDQSSLDRHVFATHPSRTIRFQCNHCHHMFTKKEDLFLHMSDIHGLRPPMDELDQSHIQRLQPGIVDLTEPHTEMATFSTAVDPGLLFPVDNQAANMANPESMLLTLNGSQIHFS